MAMKTLTQVNAKARYTFDPREMGLKQPKILARIARAISIWSSIEALTKNVLKWTCGYDVRIAAEMFLSITSAPASNAVLKTAVRLGLKPEYAELFNAIWAITGDLIEDRHRLVHWVIGYSKDIPGALLLFDPRVGFRRGTDNMAFWRLGQHHRFTRRPINKIRVASAEYLDGLIADFLAHQDRILAFLDLLRLNETVDVSPSLIQQRYDLLCNEPQIFRRIALIRGSQKNKKVVLRRSPSSRFRRRK
jgi:hypothetical protein